jgi:hypothetical protein
MRFIGVSTDAMGRTEGQAQGQAVRNSLFSRCNQHTAQHMRDAARQPGGGEGGLWRDALTGMVTFYK